MEGLINKQDLSESDICAKCITPAVMQAGWDEATQIRREVGFTKGRIIVRGKLVTEGLRDYSRKAIRQHYASLDDFLRRWQGAERKEAVIDELAEEGLLLEPLREEVGTDLDPFDLICHIVFDQPPLTRRERANNVRRRDVFSRYGPQARAVLEALLIRYQDEGTMTGLDDTKILEIPPFNILGTPIQLIRPFGSRAGFEQAVHELQATIYQEIA